MPGSQRCAIFPRFELLTLFPLFPLFKNRVISPNRRHFGGCLRMRDPPETAEPAGILELGGGYRATDSFERSPKLCVTLKVFHLPFFGMARYVNAVSMRRIDDL